MSPRIILSMIMLLPLAACGPQKTAWVNQAPDIAPAGGIRTSADYEAAVAEIQYTLPDALARPGVTRLVVAARLLSLGDTAASRGYAAALRDVLVHNKVSGADQIVIPDGEVATLSYHEVARLDAITRATLSGNLPRRGNVPSPDDAADPGPAISLPLWKDVLEAITAYCPSDTASMIASFSPLSPFPRDVVGPFDFRSRSSLRFGGELLHNSLTRLADEKRLINLTTVSALSGIGQTGLYVHFAKTRDNDSEGRPIQFMVARLDRTLYRARQTFPGDPGLQPLAQIPSLAAHLNTLVATLDDNLILTRAGNDSIRDAVSRLSRSDPASLDRLRSSNANALAQLQNAIRGGAWRNAEVQSISPSTTPNAVDVQLKLPYSPAQPYATLTMTIKRSNRWLVDEMFWQP